VGGVEVVDVMDGGRGDDDSFWDPPMFELGDWLRRRRRVMDTNECRWLEVLADFERDEAYACDGHLTAASWLIWATGMARSTAYEKLRMAAALSHRPIVKDAFAGGEISYSAARAICSLDDPDPETDTALVNLARVASVVDVEAAVRYYQLLASQDLPPYEPTHREVSTRKGHYGLGQFRAVLANDEVALIEAVIKAYMAARANPDSAAGPFDDVQGKSARADTEPGDGGISDGRSDQTDPAASAAPSLTGAAHHESARADTEPSGSSHPPVDDQEADERGDRFDTGADADDWRTIYGATRADAVVDIFNVALANLGGGHLAGADRYMVHVVTDTAGLRGEAGATAELVDGSVLPEGVVARMACDASFVAHLLADGSEPLALGRRVRDWTPAQRRAIKVRDRGRCRFPGCQRGVTEIHHIVEWSEGGPTDVSNGASLCGRHHVLVHQGFRAVGNANEELAFHRPNGSVLGTSRASRRPATLRRWSTTVAA
jgi:hypothetical protein